MMDNNYENQRAFSKTPLNENLISFSKDEAVIGQFCSQIFKDNENYLIGYLNSLIHGILTATRDF